MNILNIFAKSKVEQKMENGFFVFDFNKIAENCTVKNVEKEKMYVCKGKKCHVNDCVRFCVRHYQWCIPNGGAHKIIFMKTKTKNTNKKYYVENTVFYMEKVKVQFAYFFY